MEVDRERAEEIRKKLMESNLLDRERKIVVRGDKVLIPVRERVRGLKTVDIDLPPVRKKPRSLEDALRGEVPDEVLKLLVKSFDIIGHVAIIEIPPELRDYEGIIAQAIMEVHPNVKTVAVEEGPHEGPYRVQPVRVIGGMKDLVTRYREHGVDMWLEVGKVYFSVRHSFERRRIALQVKPGEVVAALFAGVGPYPLVISRLQPRVGKVYAVEMNPEAWKWMVYNIEKNRMTRKIIPVLGDVRDVVPRMFPRMADRVIMPLPKTADDFLDVAMEALKPEGGVIHLYGFGPSEDPYRRLEERIKEVAASYGYRIEILERRKVSDYAPRVWKVVVDARILPKGLP